MSYHRYNNLPDLLNRYLAVKIGRGILSCELMDRECNCSLPSEVNVKCVYKDKFREIFLTYQVKFSMCEAIYIGNTHQKSKRIMKGHLFYTLYFLKMVKDQNHLLPIPSITFIILRHIQIYASA